MDGDIADCMADTIAVWQCSPIPGGDRECDNVAQELNWCECWSGMKEP